MTNLFLGPTGPSPHSEPPILLSAEQAAALLAINRSTVYELLARGELVSFKIGRRRLISRSAIDQFIAEREAGASR